MAKKKELITIEQLSKKTGIKLNRISGYVRQGFLHYEEQKDSGKRYYNEKRALKRFKKIKELEKEGYTNKEMKEYFSKKDLDEIITKITIFKNNGDGKKYKTLTLKS